MRRVAPPPARFAISWTARQANSPDSRWCSARFQSRRAGYRRTKRSGHQVRPLASTHRMDCERRSRSASATRHSRPLEPFVRYVAHGTAADAEFYLPPRLWRGISEFWQRGEASSRRARAFSRVQRQADSSDRPRQPQNGYILPAQPDT